MMADLPMDLGKVNYKNRDGEVIKYGKDQARRNAFALCVIHRVINDMIIDYRYVSYHYIIIIISITLIIIIENEYANPKNYC